jgi:hypothetical protein
MSFGPRALRIQCAALFAFNHDGLCGNGYRSAKRQGKPNFTIASRRLQDRHFCDSAFSARAARLHPVHRDT